MEYTILRRSAFAIAATGLLMSTVLAQAPGTGAMRGTVYDATGSVIRNATATLVSEATDGTRSSSTNSTGAFTFPLLAPGAYTSYD